jgi:hypothetical protein
MRWLCSYVELTPLFWANSRHHPHEKQTDTNRAQMARKNDGPPGMIVTAAHVMALKKGRPIKPRCDSKSPGLSDDMAQPQTFITKP